MQKPAHTSYVPALRLWIMCLYQMWWQYSFYHIQYPLFIYSLYCGCMNEVSLLMSHFWMWLKVWQEGDLHRMCRVPPKPQFSETARVEVLDDYKQPTDSSEVSWSKSSPCPDTNDWNGLMRTTGGKRLRGFSFVPAVDRGINAWQYARHS